MICNQGDIVLVFYPFTSGDLSKKRPCVVLSQDRYTAERHEFVGAPITSQIDKSLFYGDYLIEKWKESGLLKPSIVKGIVITMEEKRIERKLGKLPDEEISLVLKSIFQIF